MAMDFPKLESPLKRDKVNGKYVCVPEFNKEYKWIFDKEKVIASEKLDGTGVSIVIKDKQVKEIYNRSNPVGILTNKKFHQFIEGINNSLKKEYFTTEKEGQIFGELLGEIINGNHYEISQHIWFPFEYIRRKYLYKFWYDFIDEVNAEDDQDIYSKLSDLFKVLKSRYAIKHEQDYFAEGIVFYNKETGQMCKLRRDMFDWFKEEKHKWKHYEVKA